MRLTRWCAIAVLGLTTVVGTAEAQFQTIVRREVNLDYYLLGYFNRLSALPKRVAGDYENHYSALNLISPGFFFLNHDLDFLSSQTDVRSAAMGGAGVATARGAGAAAVNPAGLARGTRNELYFSGASRFGNGSLGLASGIRLETQVVGDIVALGSALEPRSQTMPIGMFAAGRPLRGDGDTGLKGFLGRFTLAGGYRRFVETNNGTNFITDFQPEGGIQGNTAQIKDAAQSRETGGIDAFVLSAATSFGSEDSPLALSVGATGNMVNGKVDAEQVYTVSVLTQIVVDLPDNVGARSFLRQKFTAEAYDFGAQLHVLGDLLSVGGVYRPGFELRMRSGKYQTAELGIAVGNPNAILIYSGDVADYDLNIPDQLRLGGALSFDRLIGDGEDRSGILGRLHRFFGRGQLAVDYTRLEASTATVTQKQDSLRNGQLDDDPLWQELALDFDGIYADTFGDGYLRTTMPLYNGNAGLRDQESIHIGFETKLVDRSDMGLDLRFGWGQVPLAFPSLVLGEERYDQDVGAFGRPVLRNPDGTPVLEDADGSLYSFGMAYRSGSVEFAFGFRSVSYDYVTWWGGRQPRSWYNPVTFEFDSGSGTVVQSYNPDGNYEEVFPAPGTTAGAKVSRTDNQLQISATLAF